MILETIKELCTKKEISIARLEKDLELGRGAIGKWNKSNPTVGKLTKVADYFQVSVDYLLGVQPAISNEALEFAKQFDLLSDKQKDLIKCYLSII